MSAQVIQFPGTYPLVRAAPPAPPVDDRLRDDAPLPDLPADQPHWWWRVENIILTTLAIAYAILVWGGHIRFIAQQI